MNKSSAKQNSIFASAHPLALRLIDALGERAGGAVLEIGTGSGRNLRALEAAGLTVVSLPDERPYTQLDAAPRSFAGALSTHAYLHGTAAKVRLGIAELARVLAPGAPVFLTLGSIEDVRYGFGERLDEHTFAPGEGPEIGIPHAFFDRDGALDVVRPLDVLALDEVDVDDIVGRWAHGGTDEMPGKRHWFVSARAREGGPSSP